MTGAEASSPRNVMQAEARLAAEGLTTEPQLSDLPLRAALSQVGARSQWLAWEYHSVAEHIDTP
jgi:hypothetical protein